MSIRRLFLLLVGLLLGTATAVRAVTVTATVSVPGNTPLPATVFVAVSTYPVKDAGTAFQSSTYVDVKSTTIISLAPFDLVYTGLPFAGSTLYHFYGFIDLNADGVMGSTEPRGGYGPFPYHETSATFYAVSPGATGGVTLTIIPRAGITGTVTNNSSQPGQRVMVRAVEDMTYPPPDHEQKSLLPIFGGTYTLDGLKETGNSYRVEAWVDTEDLGMPGSGEWNAYEDGSTIYPAGVLHVGEVRVSQNIVISSGAVGGSAPDHIRLSGADGSGYQTIGSGLPSADLRLSIRDAADALTSTPTATQVYLTAFNSGSPFTPEISTDTVNFSPWGTPLVIPAGQAESAPFRFRSTAVGPVTLQAEAVSFPTVADSRFAWYNFNVISGAASFTGLRARTTSQPPESTGTTITVTPDRDGTDDGAVLFCDPPTTTAWELLISSDPAFSSGIVRRFYGFGSRDSYWYGDGMEGRTVPNGIYYARYQTAGQGIVSSTVAVTVQAAGIEGKVVDGNDSPLSEVDVNVYGAAGGSFQRTGEDGRFFVNGLKGNTPYQVELRKTGFVTLSFSTTTASALASAVNVGTQTLSMGVTLAVQVSVSSAPSRDVYGSVNVHNADYSETQWSAVHVASGSTVSDNGRYAGDPQFGPTTNVSVRPNIAYTVEVNLPDFGRSTQSVTSPSSGVSNVNFSLTRKPNVYGRVLFPSAMSSPFGGEWVSVDATPSGTTMPAMWGGAFVPNGQSGGVYQLFGLNPGNYLLRAFVRGFITSTATVTVSGGDVGDPVNGGADFPAFMTGGQVTGTVTVIGNSSDLNSSSGGGPACSSGFFPVNISANSRSTYNNAFGHACLSTSTTSTSGAFVIGGLADGTYELFSYLPGFESYPSGAQKVTVAGGSGTKDLTFKALTGQTNIQAFLPAGDDGTLVSYSLSKDSPNEVNRTGGLASAVVLSTSVLATASEGRLGTGLYRLVVKNNNPGRGLVQESVLAVTNGSSTTVSVDMTIPSHAVSGSLSVQGNIVLPSTWSVTVSSVPGLSAVGANPIVDVYSFPLPTYYQDSFRPLRSVPATVDASSATYAIPGLAPGGYLLRVREDLNPSAPSCTGCMAPPGLPEMASDSQLIYVGTGAVTGADLTMTDGVKISGTISRPSGDTSVDVKQFSLRLRRSDNLKMWGLTAQTAGTGKATFVFPHVAPGDYVLETSEEGTSPRYSSPSLAISVSIADLTVDVALSAAGAVVGRLRDADTQTLLTADNASQFLPENFEIAAQANPWVPGGYIQAVRNTSGPGFSFDAATGQFRIPRLIPGLTYDLRLRGYSSLGNDALSRGVRTYAPTVVSGLQVSEGQTVDVGTVDLKQGGVLSGTVRNGAGVGLPNVRVTARPAQKNGGDQGILQIETFTQDNGHYELHGVDRSKRYYDITAAPRFRPGETFARLSGPRYAEERLRRIDVNDPAKLEGNDFVLSAANGVVTGRVDSFDGSPLTPAFSDGNNRGGERGADIVLHREGASFDDNPLGEIEERTSPDGTFRVEGLKPGAYTLRALALGHASAIKSIVVPAGTTHLGVITLGTGASVSGEITKPDGTSPSLNEVNMVLGVDENFEDFVFGTLESNLDTQRVTGYSITGFRTGKSYSLVIVSAKDDILEAQTGVVFEDESEERVIPLLFRPAPPHVFVNQSQTVSAGNRVTSLRFFSSQPFRNVTANDNDLAGLLQVEVGSGTLSDVELSSSRDTLTAVYTAPIDEPSLQLRLSFYSTEKNPDSPVGDNFFFDQAFSFYAGIAARRSATISNVTGGDCSLEGETTGVTFLAGAFDVDASSSVEVGLQSADALDVLPGASSPARAASLLRSARSLGEKAYPSSGLFRAVSAAPSVNAFSPFYDIFLPAGVNHLLKKEALLTLAYDESVTDPSGLNVYFYDPIHNVFLLEKAQKSVDQVNHTITVAVGHLSTFVVLPRQVAIIGTSSFSGQDVQVHNVPNPFSLKTKTLTLTQAAAADQVQTIEGTMIRTGLPAGKSGEMKIEIYDAAGTLVRVLTQSAPSGGTYYYLEWNGRNEQGDPVASGVYLARFTLSGGDEKMFKMAVLK